MDSDAALETEVSRVEQGTVFGYRGSRHTSLEVFRALVEGSLKRTASMENTADEEGEEGDDLGDDDEKEYE